VASSIQELNKKYKKAGWSLAWKKPEVKEVTPKKLKSTKPKTIKELRESNQPFSDFPSILLFKRMSYRIYPNGQKIGLYQNDKYGVTIPITMSNGSSKLPSLAAANNKVNELYNGLDQYNQTVMLKLLESDEGVELLDRFIKEHL
jgi:hypothetical protein